MWASVRVRMSAECQSIAEVPWHAACAVAAEMLGCVATSTVMLWGRRFMSRLSMRPGLIAVMPGCAAAGEELQSLDRRGR